MSRLLRGTLGTSHGLGRPKVVNAPTLPLYDQRTIKRVLVTDRDRLAVEIRTRRQAKSELGTPKVLAGPAPLARPIQTTFAWQVQKQYRLVTRERPTYQLYPPQKVNPEDSQASYRKLRVKLARNKVQPVHSRLEPPAILASNTPLEIHLARNKPQPIHSKLSPPAVVAPAAQPPVVTTLEVRLAPRVPFRRTHYFLSTPVVVAQPTAAFIASPVEVKLADQRGIRLRTVVRYGLARPLWVNPPVGPPPVVTTLEVKLAARVPFRRTHYFLAPPAVVGTPAPAGFIAPPLEVRLAPALQRQRRDTQGILGPPVVVTAPPVLPEQSEIRRTLAPQPRQPRRTKSELPVVLGATPAAPLVTTLEVKLAASHRLSRRARSRAQSRLAPPAILASNTPLDVRLAPSHRRSRRPSSILREPAVVTAAALPTERTIRVRLAPPPRAARVRSRYRLGLPATIGAAIFDYCHLAFGTLDVDSLSLGAVSTDSLSATTVTPDSLSLGSAAADPLSLSPAVTDDLGSPVDPCP